MQLFANFRCHTKQQSNLKATGDMRLLQMWSIRLGSFYYILITAHILYHMLLSTHYVTCLFLSANPSPSSRQRHSSTLSSSPSATLALSQLNNIQTTTRPSPSIIPDEEVSNKIELSLQPNTINIDQSTEIDYWYYNYATGLGVQRAVNECRNKFKWDRWNCPKRIFADILSLNPNVTVPNNREVAFVRAIMASGVVLSVQQNCSKTITTEQLYTERNTRDQAQRIECIKRGLIASRYFLDDSVPEDALDRSIILQNYEAGRQAFSHSMKELCKCHGVSGSCTTKTCWKQPANLAKIADYLRKQYRLAAKVASLVSSAKPPIGQHPKSLSQQLNALDKSKLVFSDASPEYCYENKELGINGTLGRYCSMAKKDLNGNEVSKSERNSCERLCTDCGYKIHTTKTIVKKTCNCKFRFCCVVECVPCQKEEEIHQCVEYS